MKKSLIYSIMFSLCFSIFSQNALQDSVEESISVEEATKAVEAAKKAEKESEEWEEIIQNELQQGYILEKQTVQESEKSEQTKDETKLLEQENNKLQTEKENTETDNKNKKSENENVSDEELSQNLEQTELSENIEDVLPDDKTVQHEEIKEEIIQKIPLSIASEEILARPDVEKFRQQYMSPKWSALLYSYLESAMEYRLYVRQQIKERNLPEVLEYLPVVESNYKTSAKSYSGAVGMWQFMSNSVYPFLTLNDFVDQRLDPWYSTDAGLSKLEDNYNYFGDWLIAIAAYNCGGGAMSKAIKNAGVKDYWYLADNGYIPKQTSDYIPKLLAIADLAINSEYYGIDLPNHNEEFELLENEKNGLFDYITVNKAYSINDLAKELRIEQSTMARLNASYIHGITHPTKESKIRLPLGMASAAESAISKLTPIDYPFKYKVVSGDSLWSISRKYHVTVNEICELNNIKENDILSIGKILYIPSK